MYSLDHVESRAIMKLLKGRGKKSSESFSTLVINQMVLEIKLYYFYTQIIFRSFVALCYGYI
jgi:hypothetical protein